MKKAIMPFACAIAILGAVSCGQSSNSGTETDSTTMTNSSTDASANAGASTSSVMVDTTASYVDLSSGKTIRVRKDNQSGRYMNSETNEPLMYYVNPTTADTFDVQGRVVNNALIKGTDGSYTVDENKITTDDGKIKMQSDNDLKMKEGDAKAKLEKDGDMKLKDENSKIKVRDGEVEKKE